MPYVPDVPRYLHAVVRDMSRVFRVVMPHMVRALHALVPHAVCAFFPHLLCTLGALVPLVTNFRCPIPNIISCILCLVTLVSHPSYIFTISAI